MINKLYLILYNKEKRIHFVRYFETEFEMDKYKRRIPYFNNIILIEDSRDIYFFGGD